MHWNNNTKRMFVVFVVAITLVAFGAHFDFFESSSSGVSHKDEAHNSKAFQVAYLPETRESKLSPRIQSNKEPIKLNSQCDVHINKKELTPDWAKAKRYELQRLFKQDTTELAVFDYAFSQLGFTVSRARALQSNQRQARGKPRYHESILDEASIEQQKLVRNFIRYGEAEPIAKAVDAGEFRFDVSFQNGRGMASLLEHIIVKADEPEDLIHQMMSFGLVPTYTDLAAATVFGVSSSVVSDMYYASGLNANKILRFNGRYHSLLTHAVGVREPTLVEFWLEQGAPINPDPYAPNALDMLQKSAESIAASELNSMAQAMLATGATPNTQAGKNWLNQLLTEKQKQRFKNQLLGENTLKISSEQQHAAEVLMQNVRDLILNEIVDFDFSSRPAHTCLDSVTRYIAQFIENTAMKPSGTNVIQEKKARKVLLERIKQAEGLFTQQSDIETFLGADDSIESKEIVEAYRRELLHRTNKENRQRFKSKSDYDDIEETTRNIYETVLDLVKEKRWQEAVEYLQFNGDEQMMPFLVNLFILYNAPNHYVFELLDSGISLAPTIIYQLLRKDDVELTKALIPYGLDLNFTNTLGESALLLSVSYRAEGMFAFMLSQGVDLNTNPRTFDALDVALEQIDIKYGKDVFVKGLIEAGIAIRLSHKQWVKRKQTSHKQTYDYLVGQYPQLL